MNSQKVEIVRKLPLQETCQGGSPGNTTLDSSAAYDMRGIGERSFESVSKDKPAIRRRAAFDADEKDVTKEDVKTPLLRTILNSSRSDHNHEIYSILRSDLPEADHTMRHRAGFGYLVKKRHCNAMTFSVHNRRLWDGPGRQIKRRCVLALPSDMRDGAQ